MGVSPIRQYLVITGGTPVLRDSLAPVGIDRGECFSGLESGGPERVRIDMRLRPGHQFRQQLSGTRRQ